MLSGSAARGHMGIGLIKIKHVKLPVTDLRRSVCWYQSVLDLELHMEFVEQGVLRGVSLLDREGGYESPYATGKSAPAHWISRASTCSP